MADIKYPEEIKSQETERLLKQQERKIWRDEQLTALAGSIGIWEKRAKGKTTISLCPLCEVAFLKSCSVCVFNVIGQQSCSALFCAWDEIQGLGGPVKGIPLAIEMLDKLLSLQAALLEEESELSCE